MQPSKRMAVPVAVAVLAGVLQAVQLRAPELLTSGGVTVGQLSLLLTVLGVLSLAVSPFGIAVAGYVWGTGVAVQHRWLSFVGATLAGAIVGFGATYLLATALVLLGGHAPGLAALAVQSAYHAVSLVGLAGVALAGLAGAAVAEFQDGESRNSSTVQA